MRLMFDAMQWYYAREGMQLGPVSAAEFDALVRSGQIDDATLVWREGMATWQPYGLLREPASGPPVLSPTRICSVCRQAFPPDQLLDLLGRQVCASCKPTLVQGLREGVAVDAGEGLWQQGNQLVMARDATLPHRCVKCNVATTGPQLKRSLSWHHSAYYLLLLIALLIYVIVAVIVSQRARIEIGLCPRHRRLRQLFLGLAWTGSLLGIAGIIYGFANESALGLVGLLVLLGGIIAGNFGARMVYASRIDGHHIWLKGVSREYLSGLPEWTGK